MKEDYLKFIGRTFKEYVKEDVSITTFLSTLKKSSIKFTTKFDYANSLKRAEELNSVLNIITSIVSKPHFISTTSEIVQRSELANKLSRDSFNETIKDTKLWKHKGKEIIPEYVHTVENLDTIVTYENKFIARLINFISKEASELEKNLLPLTESLEESYESNSLGFNEHSFINDFTKLEYPYQNIFQLSGGDKRKLFEVVKRVNKRSLILKNTNFYKENMSEAITFPIMLTNILIHDKLYAYCYKFYKDNYLGKVTDYSSLNNDFYNYFVSNLLYEISKTRLFKVNPNKSTKIYLDEAKNIRIKDLAIHNMFFKLVINDDFNNLGLKIDISLNQGVTKHDENLSLIESRNYIKLIHTLNETNKISIQNELNKLNETYDNVITGTLYNEIKDYTNVVSLSLFKDNHDVILMNVLSSLVMLFVDDENDFVIKCPVCGTHEVKLSELDYECNICKGKFTLFQIGKINYMWIKSFRRTK